MNFWDKYIYTSPVKFILAKRVSILNLWGFKVIKGKNEGFTYVISIYKNK